nr:EOG090X0B7I [Artemia franciscana]
MDNNEKSIQPGDAVLVEDIVNQLKSQGIFDQWRKDCLADVDTKPAYQNLQQRVESTVSKFLEKQYWSEKLNKNQLRERLRKHVISAGFLDKGLDRITDQVVDPKTNRVFLPVIQDAVYGYLGIENPNKKAKPKLPALMALNLQPHIGAPPGLYPVTNINESKQGKFDVGSDEMALESDSSSSSPTPPAYSPIGAGLPSPRSDSSPMRISPENVNSSPNLRRLHMEGVRRRSRSESDASSMDISCSPDMNEMNKGSAEIVQEETRTSQLEERGICGSSPAVQAPPGSALSQISSDISLPPGVRTPLLDESITPPPPPGFLPGPPDEVPPPPPPSDNDVVAPPPPKIEDIAVPPEPPQEPPPPTPPLPENTPALPEPPALPPTESVDSSPLTDIDIVKDGTSPASEISKVSSPTEDSDIEVRVMNVSASVKRMGIKETGTISPDSVSSISLAGSSPSPLPPSKPHEKGGLDSMLSDISDSPEQALVKSPSDEGEIESDKDKRKHDKKDRKEKIADSDSGEISSSSSDNYKKKKKERGRSTSTSSTSETESSSQEDRRRRSRDRDRDRGHDRDRNEYSRRSSYDRKDDGRGNYQRSSYYGSRSKDYYRGGDTKGRQMDAGNEKIVEGEVLKVEETAETLHVSDISEVASFSKETEAVTSTLETDIGLTENPEVASISKDSDSAISVLETNKVCNEKLEAASLLKDSQSETDIVPREKSEIASVLKDSELTVSSLKTDMVPNKRTGVTSAIKDSGSSISTVEAEEFPRKKPELTVVSKNFESLSPLAQDVEDKSGVETSLENGDLSNNAIAQNELLKVEASDMVRNQEIKKTDIKGKRVDLVKNKTNNAKDAKNKTLPDEHKKMKDKTHDKKSHISKSSSRRHKDEKDRKERAQPEKDKKKEVPDETVKSTVMHKNRSDKILNDKKDNLDKGGSNEGQKLKRKTASSFEEMRKVMRERRKMKELSKENGIKTDMEKEAVKKSENNDASLSLGVLNREAFFADSRDSEENVKENSVLENQIEMALQILETMECDVDDRTKQDQAVLSKPQKLREDVEMVAGAPLTEKSLTDKDLKEGTVVVHATGRSDVIEKSNGNTNLTMQAVNGTEETSVKPGVTPKKEEIPSNAQLLQNAMRPPPGRKTILDLFINKSDDEILSSLEENKKHTDSVIPALDLYQFDEYRTWGKKSYMVIQIGNKTYDLTVNGVQKAIHPSDLMKHTKTEVTNTEKEISGKRNRKINSKYVDNEIAGPPSPVLRKTSCKSIDRKMHEQEKAEFVFVEKGNVSHSRTNEKDDTSNVRNTNKIKSEKEEYTLKKQDDTRSSKNTPNSRSSSYVERGNLSGSSDFKINKKEDGASVSNCNNKKKIKSEEIENAPTRKDHRKSIRDTPKSQPTKYDVNDSELISAVPLSHRRSAAVTPQQNSFKTEEEEDKVESRRVKKRKLSACSDVETDDKGCVAKILENSKTEAIKPENGLEKQGSNVLSGKKMTKSQPIKDESPSPKSRKNTPDISVRNTLIKEENGGSLSSKKQKSSLSSNSKPSIKDEGASNTKNYGNSLIKVENVSQRSSRNDLKHKDEKLSRNKEKYTKKAQESKPVKSEEMSSPPVMNTVEGKRIRKLSTKYGDDFLMVPKSYREAGEERLHPVVFSKEDDDYEPHMKKSKQKTELIAKTPRAKENFDLSPKLQTCNSLDSTLAGKNPPSPGSKKPTVLIPKPRMCSPVSSSSSPPSFGHKDYTPFQPSPLSSRAATSESSLKRDRDELIDNKVKADKEGNFEGAKKASANKSNVYSNYTEKEHSSVGKRGRKSKESRSSKVVESSEEENMTPPQTDESIREETPPDSDTDRKMTNFKISEKKADSKSTTRKGFFFIINIKM